MELQSARQDSVRARSSLCHYLQEHGGPHATLWHVGMRWSSRAREESNAMHRDSARAGEGDGVHFEFTDPAGHLEHLA